MPSGSAASGRNAAKSVAFQGVAVGVDDRQMLMAVGGGATMARQVLDHGKNATARKSRRHGGGDGGDLVRALAIGAIPDHPVRAGNGHVGQGQAIDGDAHRGEVGSNEAGAEMRRPQAEGAIPGIEAGINRAGGIGGPMGRPQPLHPAALLIDQHRGVAPTANRPKFVSQRVHLCGIDDIALEQDEAPRRGLAQE